MACLVRWLTRSRLSLLAALLVLPVAAGPAFAETRVRSLTPGLPGGPVTLHLSDSLRQLAQTVAAAVVTVRASGAPSEATGFVVDPQGYVVTTDQAVRGGGFVEVTLGDGRTVPIVALSRDPASDLAILKVDATGLPAIPLARATSVRAGDLVMAVSRGRGRDATISVGVLTAAAESPAGASASALLQSDLLLGPESAGGPLVNARGEAVGILTPSAVQNGGAIAIDAARPMLQASGIERPGPDRRLGLSLQPLTPELARSFGVADGRGVLVASVGRGSPAERAGLRPGDVIVRLDGQAVATPRDLDVRLARTPIGRPVELAVVRDGAPRALRMTLESEAHGRLTERLGLALETLTPGLARRLGVEDDRGLVVTAVQPDSPAARAGIMVGDLIREVNRLAVEAISDFERGASRPPAGGRGPANEVLLRVERNGATRYVVVSLG